MVASTPLSHRRSVADIAEAASCRVQPIQQILEVHGEYLSAHKTTPSVASRASDAYIPHHYPVMYIRNDPARENCFNVCIMV